MLERWLGVYQVPVPVLVRHSFVYGTRKAKERAILGLRPPQVKRKLDPEMLPNSGNLKLVVLFMKAPEKMS